MLRALPPLELPPAASRGGWPAPLSPPRGDEASPPAFPLFFSYILDRLGPTSWPQALISSAASRTDAASSSLILPGGRASRLPPLLRPERGLTAPPLVIVAARLAAPRRKHGGLSERAATRNSPGSFVQSCASGTLPAAYAAAARCLACSSTAFGIARVLRSSSPLPTPLLFPESWPLGASLLLGSPFPFPFVESAPSRREVAVFAGNGAAGLLLSSSSSEGLARTPFGWLLTSGLAGATTKRTPSCTIRPRPPHTLFQPRPTSASRTRDRTPVSHSFSEP